MKKIVMYVYGNIQTDARVQRAANALADNYDLKLLSNDCGVRVEDKSYKNILLKCASIGPNGFFKSIWEAYKVIQQEKPDIFYGHDSYSAPLIRLLLFKNFSGKIVYDAHELIIPEENNKGARLKFFYWFEKAIVKKVNLVICASRERSQIMKTHYKLDRAPMVVENISYLKKKYDLSTLKMKDELFQFFSDSKPTLVYAGAVIKRRKIDILMDLAIKSAQSIKLLVIGNGDSLTEMQEIAANHPELHSFFTGLIPYEALGSILSMCDVGYLYYPVETMNNIYCASNKVYEYASVELPILANNNPTIKRIFCDNNIGIASDDLSSALSHLLFSLDKYKSACSAFVNANSWDLAAKSLLNNIDNL